MKNLFFTVLISTSCFTNVSKLEAKVITLTIGGNMMTNEVVIGTNEVAEVKSYYDPSVFDGNASIGVVKDGRSFQVFGNRFSTMSGAARRDGVTIAGPAVISLFYAGPPPSGYSSFLTIEITPQSFPPDKTIVIPQGGGANIGLECSTNLIDWVAATPGVYTNVPSNKFFRIRAERVE